MTPRIGIQQGAVLGRPRLDLRRFPAICERPSDRGSDREQQSLPRTCSNPRSRTAFRASLLFTENLNCHCFDPNATFVLNPAAWTNPPAGQFGTSAAYYSDYRAQRRPVENMNLGREWRIKERYRFNLRIEFTNIFNRTYVGNPTSTNALATQVRVLTGATAGNTASGFGYINTQSNTPQVGPRNGVLVARFSF